VRVLVVNAGSSSLKLNVLEPDDRVAADRDLDSPAGRPDLDALDEFVREAGELDVSVHRLVHGGDEFRESCVVDDDATERLEALGELAPLHNRAALAALRRIRELRPELPAVACFDTAFHSTLSPGASVYAIPYEWTERFDVHRFGFHGLSHAYASRRAAQMLGREPEGLRVVTCHLGAGASLAAVRDGRSVDTTMGFTPLDGLVMATRCGSIDPGAVLWLVNRAGISVKEVGAVLTRDSGLLGISGVSGDMREVLAAADEGNERARLALDVYLHRLRGAIASMAAATGGLDALVFTAGVGERSARIRAEACAGLAFLGVALDEAANADPERPDGEVSTPGAAVRTLVVEAREDLETAREARRVLGAETGLDERAESHRG
jgi:acetate kinase